MINLAEMTRDELERRVAVHLEYHKTPSGKIATRKAALKWYRKNKEKVLAQKREKYALQKTVN